ncbi:MAG TPA: HDOD domain-containing protein [Desulfobulbus sp.]|nr:HDOD domain-containing protein [Desulfobulbus sp.]
MPTTAARLIKKYKRGNTLPHIVTRLAQLINDDSSTLRDFEEIISLDPALVGRLLTLVNSSYYGLVHKVDSVSRAIALLGMKNLHNIAVTDALKGMFRSNRKNSAFSHDRLWIHCAATGICSKMIAERIFSINGDDAYLAGILHDIGLIVEWQGAEKKFLEMYSRLQPDGPSIIELEQEYIGTDHCEIGYLLAEEWQMMDSLSEAIRDHHTVDQDIAPESLTGILQISEYILNQLDFTLKENIPVSLPDALVLHIQESVDEYQVLAEDLPEEIERVRNLYGN